MLATLGSSEKYYYETPMWAVAVLCSIALVLSLLFFTAFHYWDQWGSGGPRIIKWFVFIIGLGFLVAGTRPRNWKPWRYFFADSHGMHFPSECPETKYTQWLLVPWTHVGIIKEEIFLNRYKGPSIELQLKDYEIDRFFRDVRLTKMFFGKPDRENGFFKVGYSNAFRDTDNAVRVLNEFKSRQP